MKNKRLLGIFLTVFMLSATLLGAGALSHASETREISLKNKYLNNTYYEFANISYIATTQSKLYVYENRRGDTSPKLTIFDDGNFFGSETFSSNISEMRANSTSLFLRLGSVISIYGSQHKITFADAIECFSVTDSALYAVTVNNEIFSVNITDLENIPEPIAAKIPAGIYNPKKIASTQTDIIITAENASGIEHIYKINLESNEVISVQKSGVKSLQTNGRFLAAEFDGKIEIYSLTDLVKVGEYTQKTESGKGGFIKSISAYSLGDNLYISDRDSVHGFTVSAEKIEYSGEYFCSTSSEIGKFNAPMDIFEYNGLMYVLDSGNKRIQILGSGDAGKSSQIPLGDIAARHIIVDGIGNVYIASLTNIYRYDGSSFIIVGGNYTEIGALTVTLSSSVYFADGDKVYGITENGDISSVLTAKGRVTALSIDLRNGNIFVATPSSLTKYNLITGAEIQVYTESGIQDMEIDFSDDIYIINSAGGVKVLGKEAFAVKDIDCGNNVKLQKPLKKVCIDRKSGQLHFAAEGLNIIAYLDKTILSASTEYDVPKVTASMDIFDMETKTGDFKIATVDGWPSTIEYPFHAEAKLQNVYYDSIAIQSIEVLPKNIEVIILEEIGEYYYIFSGGKVGFILKNKTTIKDNLTPPYVKAKALQSEVNVYKIPSTAKNSSGAYLYKFGTISKGEKFEILDRVADFKGENGMEWYRIKYGESIGYISRTNATKDVDSTSEVIKEAKIKAPLGGLVNVYAGMDASGEPLAKLKDNTVIKILEKHDKWTYIECENENGEPVRGYILTEYITNSAMTTLQIIGLVLLIVTLVLLILLLIIIKVRRGARAKIPKTLV